MKTFLFITAVIGMLVSRFPAGCADGQSTAQDSAIANIRKAGGSVIVDEKDPDRPVVAVDFSGDQVNDNTLKCLQGLEHLKELTLYDTAITDAGFEHLKGLGGLKSQTQSA